MSRQPHRHVLACHLHRISISQRFDVAPTRKQLFSRFTVFCLVINRTIASGIFTQPVRVLQLAGSSGVALVIWIAAGIIILCVVESWIELALTIPIHYIFRDGGWQRVSSPRNGGDKNYVSLFTLTSPCSSERKKRKKRERGRRGNTNADNRSSSNTSTKSPVT